MLNLYTGGLAMWTVRFWIGSGLRLFHRAPASGIFSARRPVGSRGVDEQSCSAGQRRGHGPPARRPSSPARRRRRAERDLARPALPSSRRRTGCRATTLLHGLHRRRYFRPPALPSSSVFPAVPPGLLRRWPGACGLRRRRPGAQQRVHKDTEKAWTRCAWPSAGADLGPRGGVATSPGSGTTLLNAAAICRGGVHGASKEPRYSRRGRSPCVWCATELRRGSTWPPTSALRFSGSTHHHLGLQTGC